jgi:hypothetical protein
LNLETWVCLRIMRFVIVLLLFYCVSHIIKCNLNLLTRLHFRFSSFIVIMKLIINGNLSIIAWCTWDITPWCNRKTMSCVAFLCKLWAKVWGLIQVTLMETEISLKFTHLQLPETEVVYVCYNSQCPVRSSAFQYGGEGFM